MPNNRQWAVLIWLAVVAVILLSKKESRSQILGLARLLIAPKIAVPFLMMTTYVFGFILIANRIGIWSPALSTDTIFWFIGSASVLLFQLNRATGERGFFRKTAIATIEVTVFIEFFMTVTVFSLPVELLLQPVLFLLIATATYAALKPEYVQVKRLLDRLLAGLGFVLIAVVLVRIITEWDDLNLAAQGFALALPIWLTLGLLPFLALASVWVSYDHVYVHVRAEADSWKHTARGMAAVAMILRLRRRDVKAFVGYWPRQLAKAQTFREARGVVAEYLRSREEARKAERERQRLQKQYEGSSVVDEDGRRFDRRGFDEAKTSLMTLASFQAGHFKRTGRYATSLSDILPSTMIHLIKVEPDHIVLSTNPKADEYWMFTRTPAEFCFGIAGRKGDHPTWLYAAENAPAGGIDADDWRHVVNDPAHVEW